MLQLNRKDVFYLQVSLDTSKTCGKFRVLHDIGGNVHIGDLRLAAVVERDKIRRCWHFVQLTGKRAQNGRGSLQISRWSVSLTANRIGSSEDKNRARLRRTGRFACDSAYVFKVWIERGVGRFRGFATNSVKSLLNTERIVAMDCILEVRKTLFTDGSIFSRILIRSWKRGFACPYDFRNCGNRADFRNSLKGNFSNSTPNIHE